MPKGQPKLAEYPLQTKGSRLAAKVRAKSNKLSERKRAALFNKGKTKIFAAEQVFLMYDVSEARHGKVKFE